MNFDREKFSEILIKIKNSYGSINQMAEKTGITAAYISKLIRLMYNNAPSPEILKKIANASNGLVSYNELMIICGYNFPNNIDDNIKSIFQQKVTKEIIYRYSKLDISFNNLINIITEKKYISKIITRFSEYCNDIVKNAYNHTYNKSIKDYIDINSSISYTGFKILHSGLLDCLSCLIVNMKEDDVFLINRNIILTDDFDDIKIAISLIEGADNYLKSLFKNWSKYKYYMCPVYGRISAGIPNWVEECIEGRIPIDPELMNIVEPEQCFFLKVNGESMNQLVKNGAFALIRKTDIVENGEIAVVLVNGDEATLKKFSKQGDVVVLEPMSNDPSYTTQIYNKDTDVKIIGKYIGKMEMK